MPLELNLGQWGVQRETGSSGRTVVQVVVMVVKETITRDSSFSLRRTVFEGNATGKQPSMQASKQGSKQATKRQYQLVKRLVYHSGGVVVAGEHAGESSLLKRKVQSVATSRYD